MKKISILGSTGSIGTQTLEVVRENLKDFKIVSLACGSNIKLILEQVIEFRPENIAIKFQEDKDKIIDALKSLEVSENYKPNIYFGEEGLIKVAEDNSELMVNALMGMRGLIPTYKAIQKGKDIALANKETLVAGGSIIMKLAKEKGVKILPIDSEHSAIFQSLMGNKSKDIKKIFLTASGGPFRNMLIEDFEKITVEDALKHPNWSMGQKITIDSATMMNKGLEVIEAKWLFDLELDQIEVLVHPQSILHSAVEYIDNSVIGQMGCPDMKVPISLALGYPNRIQNNEKSLNFFEEGSTFTFEKPRYDTFPCLLIAYEAERLGGTYPAVMNGANEEVVELFLQKKIKFTDIPKIIKKVMENHKKIEQPNLDEIIEVDDWARKEVKRIILSS